MRLLHHLSQARRRALMAFVLAVVGMQALIPAGVMLAPAHGQEQLAQIILCPQTHPLGRAMAAAGDADMARLHAAMGHGPAEPAAHHAGMDHAAMGHAAMGHAPAPADDDVPATQSASPAQSCAFSGLALAGLLPDRADPPAPSSPALAPAQVPLGTLVLFAPDYLRPPLRGPPALI
jgi:hypothetical protein